MRALACLLLLAALPVRAAPPPSETAIEEARGHFRVGQSLFERGDYAGALRAFEEARRVKPAPAFDYNIGVCHERLGQLREAVAAFERYLAVTLDAREAAEVRARVAGLRAQLGPEEPPRRSWAAPIAVGAVTVGILAVGVGLVASTGPAYDDLLARWNVGPRTTALQDEAFALQRREQAGYALLGIAGAAAVVDIVLWARAARRPRERALTFGWPLAVGARF